jgi:hypothetical protein
VAVIPLDQDLQVVGVLDGTADRNAQRSLEQLDPVALRRNDPVRLVGVDAGLTLDPMSEVACPLRVVHVPGVGRDIAVAAECLDQREVEKLALNGFRVANPDRPLIAVAVDDEGTSVRSECGPSLQFGNSSTVRD